MTGNPMRAGDFMSLKKSREEQIDLIIRENDNN